MVLCLFLLRVDSFSNEPWNARFSSQDVLHVSIFSQVSSTESQSDEKVALNEDVYAGGSCGGK